MTNTKIITRALVLYCEKMEAEISALKAINKQLTEKSVKFERAPEPRKRREVAHLGAAILPLVDKTPIPDGYEMLPNGSILRGNDLWYSWEERGYTAVAVRHIGLEVQTRGYIRLGENVVKDMLRDAASPPPPPKGYEMVGADRVIKIGDLFYDTILQNWAEAHPLACGYESTKESTHCTKKV